MGIAAGLAGAAAAASLGTTVAGALDGGGSAPANQTYGGRPGYVPSSQPQADVQYQNIFQQMQPYASALPGQVIPGYQTYASNIQTNPFAQQQLAGATQVGQYGQQLGNLDIAGAQALSGAGNQILTSAFDPQTALYNKMQNDVLQQSAVANAMSGVQGPYAAGTIDQSLQNFNLAWQQQQLQRELQGVQGAGQAFAGGAGLGSTGLGTYQSTSALPYQTFLGQQQADLGALSSLTGGVNAAFGPSLSEANLLQSYLGLGQTATGLAQAGQAQGFGQQQQLGAQFGQALSSLESPLSTLFSGSSPGANAPVLSNYATSAGYTDPTAFLSDLGGLSTAFG